MRMASLLLLAVLIWPAAAAEAPLVFAAASTTVLMQQSAARFESATGERLRLSFAASSVLARQIERGAPAALFLSANTAWMDYLEARDLIEPDSRADLFTNRLVLIGTGGASLDLTDQAAALRALSAGRLAIGDPEHVPVGIYAREALRGLGLWSALRRQVVRTRDARAVVTLVARGETRFGLAYRSDGFGAPHINTVWPVPERFHSPIVYPLALIAGQDSAIARAFADYLRGPEVARIATELGFNGAVPGDG